LTHLVSIKLKKSSQILSYSNAVSLYSVLPRIRLDNRGVLSDSIDVLLHNPPLLQANKIPDSKEKANI